MVKKSSKKSAKTKKPKKYVCNECGIIVSVEKECDCAETCDIICCGEEMKPKF